VSAARLCFLAFLRGLSGDASSWSFQAGDFLLVGAVECSGCFVLGLPERSLLCALFFFGDFLFF